MLKKRMMYLWSVAAFMAVMGFGGFAFAGALEPSAPPAPTMRTLEELHPAWNKIITDGSERFEAALGGAAYLDKETGLVWERVPDTLSGTQRWDDSIVFCHSKEVGGRMGWRLPTVEELASLVDRTQTPALPILHPFSIFPATTFWTATTSVYLSNVAWYVNFISGTLHNTGPESSKSSSSNNYFWCVRGGGQGRDSY